MFWINFSKASDSEPSFYNSTITNRNFRTCQISKKKVLQQITFWSELDLHKKKILMNDLLAENRFSTILSRKNATSSVMQFLKNHDIEKKWKKTISESRLSKKKQISKQVFKNASDFESRISKYVRFSVNFEQLVIFGIGSFTACQILKHLFYHTSDFDQKF